MRNVILLCILFMFNNTTEASDFSNDEQLFSMSLDELLETEFSTATLTPETIDSVPAAYSIFSRSEIKSLGVRYLHELLDYVPGFQVTRYGDFSQQYAASSRGLSVGSSSRKILFLIDGFPANDPRAGSSVNLLNYSLEHIEKVEVLRGPGSAIYGSNAFTGVVNIITREKRKQVRIQSGNEIITDLFAQWYKDFEHFTLSTQFSVINSRGDDYTVFDYLNSATKNIRDPFNQRSAIIKISNANHSLTLNYRARESNGFYAVERLSDRYESRNATSMVGVFYSYDYKWLDSFSSNLKLSFIETQLESASQSTPVGAFENISIPNTDDPLYGTGYLESHGIRATWLNNYEFDDNVSIQFGLSLQNNDETRAEGETNFDLDAVLSGQFPVTYSATADLVSKVGLEESLTAGGAFFQYQHQKGLWNWIVGARYDRYESIGGRITPRVGIVYKSSDRFQWKVLYGEAFRSPDVAELNLINGVGRVGNTSLRFESTQSLEFIGQYTSDTTRASVNYFITDYNDPIINTEVAGRSTLTNGEDATAKGWEAEIKHSFTQQTWLRAAYTHFQQLPESGFRESEVLFNFHVNHSVANTVLLGLGGDYRSSRRTLVQTFPQEFSRLDGYWRFRFTSYYELNDTLTFSFIVNNLEGAQAIGPALGTLLVDGVVHPGRQWTVGFEWEFD